MQQGMTAIASPASHQQQTSKLESEPNQASSAQLHP